MEHIDSIAVRRIIQYFERVSPRVKPDKRVFVREPVQRRFIDPGLVRAECLLRLSHAYRLTLLRYFTL
jgi:hypothetical protein